MDGLLTLYYACLRGRASCCNQKQCVILTTYLAASACRRSPAFCAIESTGALQGDVRSWTHKQLGKHFLSISLNDNKLLKDLREAGMAEASFVVATS
jgi:hypothetical protein